jgi:hypothetical protein
MSYLWVNTENELFFYGKGTELGQIFKNFTYLKYIHNLIFHLIFSCLILFFLWIDYDKGFR